MKLFITNNEECRVIVGVNLPSLLITSKFISNVLTTLCVIASAFSVIQCDMYNVCILT